MGWIVTALGAALVWLLMQTSFEEEDGEKQDYTLTLNMSGQGEISVLVSGGYQPGPLAENDSSAWGYSKTFTGSGSMKIQEGSRVELTIDADNGYYLGNNPPTSFTMTRDRTVSVEFIKEVVKHDLNVNVEGQGAVKVYVDGDLRKTYS